MQNTMDYSLLVGVCQLNNILVMGIVDFVGVFNIYKRIEFNGKRLVGESTVQPPDRYAERFIGFMEDAFIGVPECGYQCDKMDVQECAQLL